MLPHRGKRLGKTDRHLRIDQTVPFMIPLTGHYAAPA
jgi:hypothetical protein